MDDQFLRFQFEGRLASQNELNFYEAGRFYYGAARLIYTVEEFRQRGRVLSRISSRVNLDARIRASRPGSFIQDVILASAPLIADAAIKVPFDVIFAHFWSLLLPAGRSKQDAVDIGEKFVRFAEEQTDQISEVRKIVESGNATTQQALRILELVLNSKNTASMGLSLSPEELESRRQDLITEQGRERLLEPYREALQSISPEQERRFTSQIRKSAQEMLVPLRSSARNLQISLPANDNKLAFLDEYNAEIITNEQEDENSIVLRVKIKRFDRETGYGLARYDDLMKPIAFRLRKNTLGMREDVLQSMREDWITAEFHIVRDAYDTPKLLILEQVFEPRD